MDLQLDKMTEAFINDIQHNPLEGHTLYVSSLFKWFAEDFNKEIIDFFLKVRKRRSKSSFRDQEGKIKLKYFDDDWFLNGK